MSRKTDLNLSIGVDVKKGFEDAVVDIKNNGNKLASASKQIAQAIGKDYAKSYKSFNASFKETNRLIKSQQTDLGYLKNELKELNNVAKKYVVVPPKLKGEIREATAALNNQKKSIKELTGQAMAYQQGMKASKMKVDFQQAGNAIEGVARSFQVAQGAAAIFGDESEDVMQAMHKMQAVMVFTEGIRGMKHLKTSFELLSQTIKQNPLIAFGVALAAVGVAIYKFSKANDEAARNQEAVNKAMLEGKNAATKDVVSLKLLAAQATNMNTSLKNRKKAYKELQDQYPAYFENLEYEEFLTKKGTTATDKAVESLIKRAQLTKMVDRITEAQIALNEAEEEGETIFQGVVSALSLQKYDAHQASINKLKNELNNATVAAYNFAEANEDVTAPEFKGTGKGKTDQPSLFEQDNAKLENDLINAQNVVKQSYRDGLTSKHKYEQEISSIEVMFANRRLELAEKHHKQTNKLLGVSLDKQKEHLDTFATKVEGLPPITIKVDVKTPDLKENIVLPFTDANKEANAEGLKLSRQFNTLMQQGTANLASSMAENMGIAMATGGDIAEAMGTSFMAGIGDFLSNMGQMMVQAGTAKLLFDNSMVVLGGGGGAIAAGMGLILAGAALKSAMSQSVAPTPLAEGGVMKGTTFGMLAEYNTANNDPEVAIRSSYLRGMIADAVGNNGNGGNVKFRIEGRDLVGVLGRGLKDNSRA